MLLNKVKKKMNKKYINAKTNGKKNGKKSIQQSQYKYYKATLKSFEKRKFCGFACPQLAHYLISQSQNCIIPNENNEKAHLKHTKSNHTNCMHELNQIKNIT